MLLQRRYELGVALGEGASGTVYRARDLQLGRDVAVKLLRYRPTEDVARRFQREAQIAANFRHPDVCAVYDVAEHDGRPFIVMELVPAPTLATLLAGEKPLLDATLEIVAKLGAILAAAHASGLVHRDLKPANVFVEGSFATPGRCRLVDFGLAFMLDPSSQTLGRLTQDAVMVGTPLYMSPEQAEAKDVGAPTDVYSLGCMIHELVSGRPPFVGNIARIIAGHLYLPPVPLRALVPEVSEPLERLVLGMLEKNPGRRPTTPEVVARIHEVRVPATQSPQVRDTLPVATYPTVTSPIRVALDGVDPELAATLSAHGFVIGEPCQLVLTTFETLEVRVRPGTIVLHPKPSLEVISAAIRLGACGVVRWPGPVEILVRRLREMARHIPHVP
jgi:eukaryotic-like serine/threonine-protein kinase